MEKLLDNWRVRRWLLAIPCALRGHREWGYHDRYINGAPFVRVYSCACGRRRRSGVPVEFYYHKDGLHP